MRRQRNKNLSTSTKTAWESTLSFFTAGSKPRRGRFFATITTVRRVVIRIPAAAQRDKSESNLILTWPMLALGLDYVYAKHIDGYIHLHRLDGNMRFGRQSPA